MLLPCVYSYKRNLVRVLANLSYGSVEVAQRVLALDAVPLLLSQSRPDPGYNEYIREWSIFTIRNLCEVSLEVQVVCPPCSIHNVI